MKPGDMVKAAYFRSGQAGIYHEGIVVDVYTALDLFSEKYAIMQTITYVRILSNGSILTFEAEEDKIEVINEGR